MATYQLRQMSVGEIIDGALALFRHHFRIFLGIALICQGVPMALYAYVQFAGGIFRRPTLVPAPQWEMRCAMPWGR
jgi:hypothetical protein